VKGNPFLEYFSWLSPLRKRRRSERPTLLPSPPAERRQRQSLYPLLPPHRPNASSRWGGGKRVGRSLLLPSLEAENAEKSILLKQFSFTPNNSTGATRRVKILRICFRGATGCRFVPINVSYIFCLCGSTTPLKTIGSSILVDVFNKLSCYD
jgi:hypothetical protein